MNSIKHTFNWTKMTDKTFCGIPTTENKSELVDWEYCNCLECLKYIIDNFPTMAKSDFSDYKIGLNAYNTAKENYKKLEYVQQFDKLTK